MYSPYPNEVVDDQGGVHRRHEEPLGEGGQGAVFRTRANPDLALKLLQKSPRDLSERLAEVRALPLPDDLAIARPLALLRDHPGYTMPLMKEMAPIKTLIHTSSASEPPARFYIRTGGLRKRLRVLGQTARTLARLHALPALFGDVSDNNVFVSKDPERDEVWLIDADNLTYAVGDANSVYTPGFGAPEVVAGGAVGTLGDAYAFAVLAFNVLAQCHPFLGEGTETGGWDEDGEDSEQLAYNGELPWILDPNDDSNRSPYGVTPRDLVLSKSIYALFRRTFVEGRHRPAARPGLAAWTEALHRAADRTLRCSACNSTFYLARECPWCDADETPRFLDVQVLRWDPEHEAPDEPPPNEHHTTCWRLHLNLPPARAAGHVGVIPRRATRPVRLRHFNEPALEVEQRRNELLLKPLDDHAYHVVLPGGDPVLLDRPRPFPVPTQKKRWFVHCGPLDQPHRTLMFAAYLPS